jgi:hypothetical protein
LIYVELDMKRRALPALKPIGAIRRKQGVPILNLMFVPV